MNNQSSQTANGPSQLLDGFRFDFNKIVAQVKLIFTEPVTCWTKLVNEYATDKEFVLNYFAPLLVLPAAANFINGATHGSFFRGLISTVLMYALYLLMLFVSTYVIEKIAPYFKGTPVHSRVLKFVGYGWTPGLVASVFTIFPAIGALISLAAAIFGLYVYWNGITEMTGVPADQRIGFILATIVAMAVLMFILATIMGMFMVGAATTI